MLKRIEQKISGDINVTAFLFSFPNIGNIRPRTECLIIVVFLGKNCRNQTCIFGLFKKSSVVNMNFWDCAEGV
ncbi:MAG: hypothetical protein AUI16_04425 [Alphaproteobacteria bacterium 13_2_20CM_2_64_7]|nr:MAG: hypothetical protein AUI16_04425 [Alphaproteobacteria bacterium 13_2_20CM_2_64_7]